MECFQGCTNDLMIEDEVVAFVSIICKYQHRVLIYWHRGQEDGDEKLTLRLEGTERKAIPSLKTH